MEIKNFKRNQKKQNKMETKEIKKDLIKFLYDLDGELYHYKFLNFTYQGKEVKEIRKDIENLKNKINNLK